MRMLLTVYLLLSCIAAESCSAQLFDPSARRSGRSGGRRAAAAEAVQERFQREERSADDFVGRRNTDPVGLRRGETSEVSSVAGLQEELRPSLNRPKITRSAGLYSERLVLDSALFPSFNSATTTVPELSPGLKTYTESRAIKINRNRDQSAASLSGEVRSEHERRMAELIAMFEPGVRTVTNDLKVNPELSAPDQDRSDSKSRGQRFRSRHR